MVPEEVIRNIFLFVAVPLLGLYILYAAASGKASKAIGALLVLLVAAAVVFMPPSTVQALGRQVATGINQFLNR